MATTKKYVSLEKLSLYDEKIKAYLATADESTLADAKSYADGLATNYEAAGAVATAKTALEASIASVEAKADAADSKAVEAQNDIEALETYVGTIPAGATSTDIVGYVQEKTSGIATSTALAELQTKVEQAETDIDAIEADYLKAADKTALNDAITAEAETARAAEQANAAAIKAISDDYLKAADKTELQGNIDTVSSGLAEVKEDVDAFLAAAEVGDAAIDTLKEIQEYISDHGEAAATMTANIAANAAAISDLEDYVGDIPENATATDVVAYVQEVVSAEKTRAEGVEDGLDTRLSAVESAVGTSGSVATDIATAKSEAIAEAEAKDNALETKITAAYKAYADAEDAKIETRVDALESASETHALASDVTALAGRVTTAEGEIDTLQTEMDAVEALAAANEAAIKALQAASDTHALKTDLDSEIARAKAAEQANADAIAAFVECSEEDVNQLFA